MTPADMARVRAMIDEAVETAIGRVVSTVVQPIRDDVDLLKREAERLEKEDRKHSGEHRNILSGVEEIRRSGEHAKVETTEYIARTLDDFRREMKEAAQAAPQQVAATQAATVAVQSAADSVVDTQKQTRRSTAVTLIAMIIIAVLNHYLKG